MNDINSLLAPTPSLWLAKESLALEQSHAQLIVLKITGVNLLAIKSQVKSPVDDGKTSQVKS